MNFENPSVCHRVTEITDLTCQTKWFHCQGKDNPANLLTRGVKASVLMSPKLWLQGQNIIINEETRQLSDSNLSMEDSQLLKEEELKRVQAVIASLICRLLNTTDLAILASCLGFQA